MRVRSGYNYIPIIVGECLAMHVAHVIEEPNLGLYHNIVMLSYFFACWKVTLYWMTALSLACGK